MPGEVTPQGWIPQHVQEEGRKLVGRTHVAPLQMDVIDAAQRRMDYLYENFDTVVISWSGGKDSSTCLEMARMSTVRQRRGVPVKVFFLDEEVIYPETLELAHRHMADPDIEFYWVCVPSIYRNACSEAEPDFIPFDPRKEDVWTHVPPAEALWPSGRDLTGWRVPPSIPKRAIIEMFGPANHPENGKVVSVTGLRTKESLVRHNGIMKSQSFVTMPEHGVHHARPIYDWTARDIWYAIKVFGWDYNHAYDKLWRLGQNVETARVAPLFHAEACTILRTVMLGWPRFWPSVRKRVRGAHAMAIYGGRLHKIERFNSETWRDAAERYFLNLGSAEDKADLQTYVQGRLNAHAAHTTEPMPDQTPCPKCGISWRKIARAVARGDRQHRMLKGAFGRIV